jgi:hypothetical protein
MPLSAISLLRLMQATLALTCLGLSGCLAVNQHITGVLDTLSIHAKQHRDLAAVRSDTREKLAEERESLRRAEAQKQVEQARIDSEQKRLEMELCIANQQQQQEQLRSNIRQSLESRIAFNAQHGLEVGELEVDIEALKSLIEKREQQRQRQTLPPSPPCSCCDKPCGCRPGLLRRLCPRCSRKPCQAEIDCGGPAALAQLKQEPLREPLRPAEIPLKLPVKLTFGVQQPQVDQPRVVRQPLTDTQKGDRPRCPDCGRPGGRCVCPDSCVDGSLAPPVIGKIDDEVTPPTPQSE